jgi:hypothetical protein
MILHDASDIPLDFLRIFMVLDWNVGLVGSKFCFICDFFILPVVIHVKLYIFIVRLALFLPEQYTSYLCTVVGWAYYRLYFLSIVVLRSVIQDPTTSFVFPCADGRHLTRCQPAFYAEMGVYVLLLGALQLLHIVWFQKMLMKGYRMLASAN